ncbi:MAG: gliding motility-associated C-terminal domain-containing protein [Flavobacteriales bacterium]
MKSSIFRIAALLFLLFALSQRASATHNRAGEITYQHMQGLTYKVTITTYTKASAVADRPWLKLKWGDEPDDVTDLELDSLQRINGGGNGEEIPGTDIKKNIYEGEHTYAGPGMFYISMEDPNRNAGVLNINNGEPGTPQDEKTSTSVMAVFSIQSLLVISPLTGHNNSVELINPPTQDACIFQPWEHNPVAYDADDDQLVFSLVQCLGNGGLPLDGWESPQDYTDSNSDTFTIDSENGDILWLEPLVAGEYNIAILIEEYRDGYLVGAVLRDMQINVVNCNNHPPVITQLPDYCINAGESLEIFVSATDPDAGTNLTMSAYSGIFSEVEHPATYSFDGANDILEFNWEPECEEVRLQPYYVSFVATDDDFPNLSDFETISIRVVAPRVENPSSTATGNSVLVQWDATPCLNSFETFEIPQVKYEIYRHVGFTGWTPGQCELGVPPETGYSLAATVDGALTTSWTDNDVVFGGQYCYMIVTIWPDGAVSYASAETCVIIEKQAPVMLKVSIGTTNVLLGNDTIWWTDPSDIDTQQYPPPYSYKLYHNTGLGIPNTIIYSSPNYPDLAQGIMEYVHEGINTTGNQHNYRVEFYSDGVAVNFSPEASSIYLQPIPGDNEITLNMLGATPWENYQYTVFRKAPGETNFTLLTTTNEATYTDTSLNNNATYCYRVLSLGTYGAPGVPDSLWNWSQEVCAQPYDMTPPCAPVLQLVHNCDSPLAELVWNMPNELCPSDEQQYNIYYTPVQGDTLQLIAVVDVDEATTYLFEDTNPPLSAAGCYAVTALDSLNLWPDGNYYQNESEMSEIICVDNCPIYFLPNVFSPNNDQLNDLFVPFEYRFVESIDLKIFNRWGNVVFETKDPAILWDGTNKDSGNMSADGVYYYTIEVNTIRLSGIATERFAGDIQLLDGKAGNQGGQ